MSDESVKFDEKIFNVSLLLSKFYIIFYKIASFQSDTVFAMTASSKRYFYKHVEYQCSRRPKDNTGCAFLFIAFGSTVLVPYRRA
jgi:hypothetical protein